MIDLGAGLGGASAAMRDRGWDVTTVDIEPSFNPDVVADLRTWHYPGPLPVDFIWLSAPCDEFSAYFMPWSRKRLPVGFKPDLSIVQGGLRIIREVQPRFWIMENVKGAQWWLGKAVAHVGPFYLWGHFPSLGQPHLHMRNKESLSSSAAARRAMIPYALSEAVALAVESVMELPLEGMTP